MYLKRNKVSKKIPIIRKGTKYVARAKNNHRNSIPVVIALRDMLCLVKNAREAKYVINEGLIKINGKKVKDLNESIKLFNTLDVGKTYVLTILPTRRFILVETNEKTRMCKVIGKKTLKNKKVQINFHDGTNILYDKKISVGDSVILNKDNKAEKIIPLEKKCKVFIISGKNTGLDGEVVENWERKVSVKFEKQDKNVELNKNSVIAK